MSAKNNDVASFISESSPRNLFESVVPSKYEEVNYGSNMLCSIRITVLKIWRHFNVAGFTLTDATFSYTLMFFGCLLFISAPGCCADLMF